MHALLQVIAAFAAATVALVAIDLLWLGFTARKPVHRGSGRSLQAGHRKPGLGLLVYGLLAIGLFLIGIHPTAPVEAAAPSTPPQGAPMVSAASAPT